MRVALKIAYDGRRYHGFSRQPNVRTVEGNILDFLIKENIIKNPRKAKYQIASRTDKGVSALSNVMTFNTDVDIVDMINAFNRSLQEDFIYAYEAAKTQGNFNPRYAKMRHYRYYTKLDSDLDLEYMMKAASMFTGLHDFSNFARIEKGRDPIREIKNIVFVFRKNEILAIDFFAQTFLWQQVRRIVSVLLKAAKNKISLETLANAISNPRVKFDFGAAPPEYLILKDITYDKVEFQKYGGKKFLEDLENSIINSL
ncbi:MAG: tRNA pseudouridine(38-40) synthase TruA [Thermoplasmata archaeon]|nr:tRNA pseudouridine(38-40) synthase TruA [Thermoplasmata archaeon]